MVIFFRHGIKKWNRNGKVTLENGKRDDSPLSENQFTLKNNLVTVLKQYKPRVIICSPFLRCRQTAELILASLPTESEPPELIINKNIAEFINLKYSNKPLELTEETMEFGFYQPQTQSQFEVRIQRFIDFLNTLEFDTNEIFVISHQSVIRGLTGVKLGMGSYVVTE